MWVGLIYLACLVFGVGYALWTGLIGPYFGGDGDAGDAGGADIDAGGDVGHDFGVDIGDGDLGHGDVLDFDAAHDLGGEVQFSPMSPSVLATFLGGFGALGVIGHYALELAWWRSLILASISGVVVAGVFYYVVKSLYSVTQASSEARVAELIGESANVSVEITAGSTGEIVYVALGSRYQSPARHLDSEEPIPRGAKVIIKRVEGGIYYVTPATEE
ncbi:MAG: NfeD family protein [Alphaproteobacteria bacterium]